MDTADKRGAYYTMTEAEWEFVKLALESAAAQGYAKGLREAYQLTARNTHRDGMVGAIREQFQWARNRADVWSDKLDRVLWGRGR